MSAPQRVNVMLSRSRDALIIIGNPNTFVQSRKGRDVWGPLMDSLRRDGHVYNGVPVKCEQHPDKVALFTEKEHLIWFVPTAAAPNHGTYLHLNGRQDANFCSGKLLNCGVHSCPHHCHQLQNHSKMQCMAIVSS